MFDTHLLRHTIVPLAVAATVSASLADDLHVPTDHATIQAAIDAAQDGDVIHIAAGEHIADSLDTVGKQVHLIGMGIQTILRPSTVGRILYIHNDEGPLTHFESLTFTGTDSDTNAVRLFNVDVTFTNCTFRDNTSWPYQMGGYDSPGSGAAVEGYGSSPRFEECRFEGNVSVGDEYVPAVGGAVWLANGSPAFYQCTFRENSCKTLYGDGVAGNGGALYLKSCTDVVLEACVFEENEIESDGSGGAGGAIYMWYVTGRVTACSFLANGTAGDPAPYSRGGALSLGHAPILIDDSNFSSNGAASGSAIAVNYDAPTLLDSSFCDHDGDEISGDWTDGGGNTFVDRCVCQGDISGDGAVGIADLLMIIDEWGPCSGCAADLTGDGTVGVGDLLIVLDAWGECS